MKGKESASTLIDVKEDLKFAQRVVSGDEKASERFVEEYTDWVLYKVRLMMKSHCYSPAREYVCCLLYLWQERKGNPPSLGDRIQCDDCMDSYIWLFKA